MKASILCRWSCLFFVTLSFQSASALEIQCYDFETEVGPERTPELISHSETWCYEERTWENGRDVTFIFNMSDEGVRSELSAVRFESGRLIHASVLKGKKTFHTIHESEIDLFQIPTHPENARLTGLRATRNFGLDALLSSEAAFNEFQNAQVAGRNRVIVREGIFEEYLEDEKQPYDAYWWPHRGVPLAAGYGSPLGKYDRFVEAYTGSNPDSLEWERRIHSLEHVDWGGHCNGWVASSILHEEIQEPLWNTRSNQLILNSDVNGMYAEASFCVRWAFYGRRYRDGSDGDLNDIYPDKFHKVLLYYIENLKKPVAMDYVQGNSVDNHIISGYRMDINRSSDQSNTFVVHTQLRMHGYNYSRNEAYGPANTYTRDYRYELTVDDEGHINSGNWLNTNPDFLWVPLAQSKCGRENPRVHHDYIARLVSESVPAREITKSVRAEVDQDIAPGESFEIDITEIGVPGGHDYTFWFENETDQHYSTALEAFGYDYYPQIDWDNVTGEQWSSRQSHSMAPGNSTESFNTQNIQKIRITNQGSETIPSGSLALTSVRYLGGE